MTTIDTSEDSLHNNNDQGNLKDEITYVYENEVLIISICWKNDINSNHRG